VYYLLAVLTPPPLAALAAGLGALAGEVSRQAISGSYLSDIATESGRRVLLVPSDGNNSAEKARSPCAVYGRTVR